MISCDETSYASWVKICVCRIPTENPEPGEDEAVACQQNADGFDVAQAATMCRRASPELATAQYPARELDPQLQPSEAEKELLGGWFL